MTSGSSWKSSPYPQAQSLRVTSAVRRCRGVCGLGFWRPMPLLAGRDAVTRLTVCDPWARDARSCRMRQAISFRKAR